MWAFGGVGAEPGGMAPSDLAIAAGDDLVAGDDQLNGPHSGEHLPENEAAVLTASGANALDVLAGRNLRLAAYHLHAAAGVHAPHLLLLLQTPRRRQVLLYYILGYRSFLFRAPTFQY